MKTTIDVEGVAKRQLDCFEDASKLGSVYEKYNLPFTIVCGEIKEQKKEQKSVAPAPATNERMVVEMCPHCDEEIYMRWNVDEQGYKAYCPVCGEVLMLCDECMCDERERTGCTSLNCDWCETNNSCKKNPKGGITNERKAELHEILINLLVSFWGDIDRLKNTLRILGYTEYELMVEGLLEEEEK